MKKLSWLLPLWAFVLAQPCVADPLADAWNRIQQNVLSTIQQNSTRGPAPAVIENILLGEIQKQLDFKIADLQPGERSEKWRILTMLRDSCQRTGKFFELQLKLDAMAQNILNWPNRQIDINSIQVSAGPQDTAEFYESLGLKMSDLSLRQKALDAFKVALIAELESLDTDNQVRLLALAGNGSKQRGMAIPKEISDLLTDCNEWSNYYSGSIDLPMQVIAERMGTVEGIAAMTAYLANSMQNRMDGTYRNFSEIAAERLEAVQDPALLGPGLSLGLKIAREELPSRYPDIEYRVLAIAKQKSVKVKPEPKLVQTSPRTVSADNPAGLPTFRRGPYVTLAMEGWRRNNPTKACPWYLKVPLLRRAVLYYSGY